MKRRTFLQSAAAAGVSLNMSPLFSTASADESEKSVDSSSNEMSNHNAMMIKRIESSEVKYPYTFVFGGDSGATVNPTGDGIFSQILTQMEELRPKPLFFANVGDFAGPGTSERHASYRKLIDKSSLPNIHVVGNHELDHASGWDNFHHNYGPENYQFAYGHTRFIAINCSPTTNGPREEDLAFLEKALKEDDHKVKVVLMHMPPDLDGHYAPRIGWSFKNKKEEFLDLLKKYKVKLVCCAHVIAYDKHEYEGISFVVSGGLGWGLCDGYGYLSTNAPIRGAFYHFVEIEVAEDGAMKGKVIRAFDGTNSYKPFEFEI